MTSAFRPRLRSGAASWKMWRTSRSLSALRSRSKAQVARHAEEEALQLVGLSNSVQVRRSHSRSEDGDHNYSILFIEVDLIRWSLIAQEAI